MIAMKQDVMLTIDESRKIRDALGEKVQYIELEGGHSSYFIGKNIDFVYNEILPQMTKYNPISWKAITM